MPDESNSTKSSITNPKTFGSKGRDRGSVTRIFVTYGGINRRRYASWLYQKVCQYVRGPRRWGPRLASFFRIFLLDFVFFFLPFVDPLFIECKFRFGPFWRLSIIYLCVCCLWVTPYGENCTHTFMSSKNGCSNRSMFLFNVLKFDLFSLYNSKVEGVEMKYETHLHISI